VSQFRAVLASGKVIVLGILVFPSLESPEVRTSGQVPLPDRTREQQLGGHAICLCGYDDAAKRYLLRNSWGPSWGQGGYCWVPYAYLHDPELASDGYALLSLASAP
jgi:C1A family cysteine protease